MFGQPTGVTFQELQLCETTAMVSYSYAIAQDILAVVLLFYIFSFPVFHSGSLKNGFIPTIKGSYSCARLSFVLQWIFLLSCGFGKSIKCLPSRIHVCAHDAEGILFPSSALISVNVMKTIPGIGLSLTSPRAVTGSLRRSGRRPACALLGSGQAYY